MRSAYCAFRNGLRWGINGSTFIGCALLALPDMLALDGNARIDELPARHGALRHNRCRIMLGGVEDKVAGDIHFELSGTPHPPSQCRGGRTEFDPLTAGIYGPVFRREGRCRVTGLLGRKTARPGLSRGLVSIHDDGFGELPLTGRNAICPRRVRCEATNCEPSYQRSGAGLVEHAQSREWQAGAPN